MALLHCISTEYIRRPWVKKRSHLAAPERAALIVFLIIKSARRRAKYHGRGPVKGRSYHDAPADHLQVATVLTRLASLTSEERLAGVCLGLATIVAAIKCKSWSVRYMWSKEADGKKRTDLTASMFRA